MNYYHVYVAERDSKVTPVVMLDLSAQDLEAQVCTPYRQGTTLVWEGRLLRVADIYQIHIFRTSASSEDLRPALDERERQRQSKERAVGIIDLDRRTRPYWQRVMWYGDNVTGEYISAPPGVGAKAEADVTRTAQAFGTGTSVPRGNLIPALCKLDIDDSRIQNIEQELRTLELETHPNAVAVLFRVFLELTVDAHRGDDQGGGPLAKRLLQTTCDLISEGRLSENEAIAVRSAAAKNSFLTPSVTRLQQWVHNPHVAPSPADLRAEWDSLEPWFRAVWPAQKDVTRDAVKGDR